MSLFERIQKKIITESSSDTTGQNKKNKKKEFSSNISKTVKVSKDTEGLGNRQSRIDATDPKQGGYSRVDDAIDAETPSGKTKLADTTKGGEVKTYKLNNTDTKKKTRTPQKSFFDPEKAKAAREKLIAKRKEYGIDRKGNISDAGVERYARKTKQLSSGSNVPAKITQADKNIAKTRAVGGEIITNKSGKVIGKTTGKYGGNLPRKRPSNAKSLEQIKKEIDSRPPDGRTVKTKTKVKTPSYKRIETKVTDKEIQNLIKRGKEAIPKKSTKVTPTKLANVDKAIKDLDDLIIGERPGEKAFTKKALKKQQRIVTKKITTPSTKEIEQSQKILDKVQNKPKITKPKVTKVKGNLFDPTGKLADQTKKANQSFKDFIKKIKTKHPKPKLSLYDPLKTKINVEPLKPLRTFIKPSITKTATKSKGLLPKLLGAVRKKPKGALGVGLLAVGAYGAIKNRTKTKTPAPNKNKLLPVLGNRETVIDPISVTYKIVGNKNR